MGWSLRLAPPATITIDIDPVILRMGALAVRWYGLAGDPRHRQLVDVRLTPPPSRPTMPIAERTASATPTTTARTAARMRRAFRGVMAEPQRIFYWPAAGAASISCS